MTTLLMYMQLCKTRVIIFQYMLEKQFDSNEKFRLLLEETVPCEVLRGTGSNGIGSDAQGQVYWYFQDSKLNILLYKEEPSELDTDPSVTQDTSPTFTLLARSFSYHLKVILRNSSYSGE